MGWKKQRHTFSRGRVNSNRVIQIYFTGFSNAYSSDIRLIRLDNEGWLTAHLDGDRETL